MRLVGQKTIIVLYKIQGSIFSESDFDHKSKKASAGDVPPMSNNDKSLSYGERRI